MATTKPDVEPVWLPAEEVVRLNAEAQGAEPGPQMADLSGVERALNRPRVLYAYDDERDVMRLGAAVLVGLLEERPFARHNQATALAALLLFVEANGYAWRGPDGPVLAAYVRALADGRYTEEGLAETLRPDVYPAEPA